MTAAPQIAAADPKTLTHRVYARVGLLGNPSDGYGGKTLSFSLANFSAEVTLTPSETIQFVEHDVGQQPSLAALKQRIDTAGYYGGRRLLMAACKRFLEHCQALGIDLDDTRNFTLSYATNVPRQTGLAGSSAIVCAAMNCLMQHYGVAMRIPVATRPELVLSAEQELGITAGLQDRVIQVYGGLVFMDFDPRHKQQDGSGGRYEALPPTLLPPLYVMYCHTPKESGRVHQDVRQRWMAGDTAVRELMTQVACCADDGRKALESADVAALGRAMDTNFDLRRQLFGDAVLGARNLRMVLLAREVGCSAKFTGSGGAVVVLCPCGAQQADELRVKCAVEGFELVLAEVAPTRLDTGETAGAAAARCEALAS